MRNHWKYVVMIAALALGLGMAAPAWSQLTQPLADPMAEDYSVHVIPFYKIDQNWFAFLVVADTSWHDLAFGNPPGGQPGGTPIFLNFYDSTCLLRSDAIVRPTRADSVLFALHDPLDAQGQFAGIPGEGVILLDGRAVRDTATAPPFVDTHRRFLTYILLINTNNNSMIRIDSIPCQGPEDPVGSGVYRPCTRNTANPLDGDGKWLRYDTFNTIAATFGDSEAGIFETWLYFFSAPRSRSSGGIVPNNLNNDLLQYGKPRHGTVGSGLDVDGAWASAIHVDAWCDEVYLGSRLRNLKCTERVRLSDLNYSLLVEFPNDACAGKPGHIETYANDPTGSQALAQHDYSGFQETIAELVPGVNMIGTGYMHHSELGTGTTEDHHQRPITGAGQ